MKEKFKNKKTSGTKEWAEKNENILLGCIHDCKYCYAKAQIVRTHKLKNAENWKVETLNPNRKISTKKVKVKNPKSVMYPSSHDITPEFLSEHIKKIQSLLDRGSSILIVSKPHLKCIKQICKEFADYKNKIEFRFSIGSADNKTLKFWEPGAPSYEERISCLKLAQSEGFKTSVSCEPMLDNNIQKVIAEVKPYVNQTIWIGKISRLKGALSLGGYKENAEVQAKAKQLLEWQSDENIIAFYKQYKNDPIIRWKDSIRNVIGIE